MKTSQILIVESQPLTAFGIQSAAPSRSACIFPSLRQFDTFLSGTNPDGDTVQVVIFGPSILIDAAQVSSIREKSPHLCIIAIQPTSKCGYVRQLFDAGLNGLLCAHSPTEELELAIQKINEGEKYICRHLQTTILDKATGKQPPTDDLTQREREVVRLIVEELTTKEIAAKLYISACTAETHRMNIIHKLGVRNTAGIVREALRTGIY